MNYYNNIAKERWLSGDTKSTLLQKLIILFKGVK